MNINILTIFKNVNNFNFINFKGIKWNNVLIL